MRRLPLHRCSPARGGLRRGPQAKPQSTRIPVLAPDRPRAVPANCGLIGTTTIGTVAGLQASEEILLMLFSGVAAAHQGGRAVDFIATPKPFATVQER